MARLPEAWLVAIKDAGPLSDFDRLTLHQAVTIVALELLRARVAGDTERRLAGDVLAAMRQRRARRPGAGPPARARSASPTGWRRSSSSAPCGERGVLRAALEDALSGALRDEAAPGAGRLGRWAHVRARARDARRGAVRARRARHRARRRHELGGGRRRGRPRRRRRRRAAELPRGALRARGAGAERAQRHATAPPRSRASPPPGRHLQGSRARSSCCSRSRTTRRCGCSATRSSGRSRRARATTAAS